MKPMRGKTPRKPRNQLPKDPVEVYCRIRPLENKDDDVCCRAISSNTVLLCPHETSLAYKNGNYKETQYTFKHVFDEYTSQKALFDDIASPLVEDVLHGKNGLLFTYGITGSGKTHTMTGTPQDQGILPRCLDMMFNSIHGMMAKKYVFMPDKMNGFDVQMEVDAMAERQRRDILPGLTQKTPNTPKPKHSKFEFFDGPRVKDPSKVEDLDEDNNYSVFVSYVEIYNNYTFDLLEELPYDPITGVKPPNSKNLREDVDRNMFVHNCTEVEITSPEEGIEVLMKGQRRRKVAHTALNAESSRSHSVFSIRLVQAPLDPIGEEVLQDKDKICTSQLSLVDLAGSERTNRTGSAGDRLREAGSINQSLMVLRTCMDILRENQMQGANKMVPYRDSKLTHLFKNYFDGEGKVRMIVCINPQAREYDETVHVMRFAEVTQEVQVARPEGVHFDLGLTPGRRRMNQQYKDAIKNMEKEGITVPIPAPRIYSMGPHFPSLDLLDANDDTVLLPLANFLQERDQRRNTLMNDLRNKQDDFRSKLLQVEKENNELRSRVGELEELLNKKSGSFQRVERKMKTLEKTNEKLHRDQMKTENIKSVLECELQEKELHIQRERHEKERLKNRFENKLMATDQHWQRNMQREKKRIEEVANAQLWSKERKLQLLKTLVNESDVEGSMTPASSTNSVSSVGVTPVTGKTPRVGPKTAPKPSRIANARSEQDLRGIGKIGSSRTPGYMRGTTQTRIRARSPPTKTAPIVNSKYHRRSRSAQEVWLEHKPIGNVELDTVLQPKINKKRSVNKLEVKDTKGVSNYLLQHQDQASDGEMQTKLYKGDVLPSAGGGTCVVFNDVETLRQISPGDRKRPAHLRPEDFDGEWTDSEDRCRIAVEGHGTFKRPKTTS